jgi:hypothetical protein
MTERAERKVALDADQGKGTTIMGIEHIMRKGSPQSLIAEGYHSPGIEDAGGMIDVICASGD